MTTIAFTPNQNTSPPFQATVTLDGNSYSLQTMWNIYRGDWYYSLSDASGNVLINAPLIGSPPYQTIYLAPGMFTTSTLAFRVSTNNFEIGP